MSTHIVPLQLQRGNPLRWYAIVGGTRSRTVRTRESPLTDEGASVRVLVLDSFREGNTFVSAYSEDLAYLTDWGYPTRDRAIADCQDRFALSPTEWRPVPDHVENAEQFVLDLVARQDC